MVARQDEVFHINQARAYIERNQWRVWDPKITTPPGLYLASWLDIRLESFITEDTIEARSYRRINALASFVLAGILWKLACQLSDSGNTAKRSKQNVAVVDKERRMGSLVHTVANILLFPPLFFFYGLYYTDVLSVLSILLTYLLHLQNKQHGVVVAGLASLAFRQTNVFWVAIYLGGLQLQRVRTYRGVKIAEIFLRIPRIWDVIEGTWKVRLRLTIRR